MSKRIFTVIITIMLMVSVVGCSEKEPELAGIWQDEEGDESFEIFSDGTGTITSDNVTYSMKWIAENNRIKFTLDFGLLGEQVLTYDYEVTNNSLVLTKDDGDTGTYLRQN